MKKLFIVFGLLVCGVLGYAAAKLEVKIEQVKEITNYTMTEITRYDLGDTECFVENKSHNLFCFRK